MVKIYTCGPCTRDDHAHCERGYSVPAGHYGGARCICPCKGKADWREQQEREARAYLKVLFNLEQKVFKQPKPIRKRKAKR